MAGQFANPLLATEPFEEVTQDRAPKSPTLEEYYNEMEKIERNLSKTSRRRWSRSGRDNEKAAARAQAGIPIPTPTSAGPRLMKPRDKARPQEFQRPTKGYFDSVRNESGDDLTKVMEKEQAREREIEMDKERENEKVRVENSPPGYDRAPAPTSPAWPYKPGEWVKPSSPRQYYPLHDPDPPMAWGGRPYLYINHHLRPPGSAQPPTSVNLHLETAQSGSDYFRLPSRSQTKLAQPRIKGPGSHLDHVDSLDKSDPSGTKWHHQSPYDMGRSPDPRPRTIVGRGGVGIGTWVASVYGPSVIGGSSPSDEYPPVPSLPNGPMTSSSSSTSNSIPTSNSLQVPPPLTQRSRTQSSQKLSSPSPLSQSTTAVDVQPPPSKLPSDTASTVGRTAALVRKLSKKDTTKRSAIKGLFGGKEKEDDANQERRRSRSPSPSPLPGPPQGQYLDPYANRGLSRSRTSLAETRSRSRSPSPPPMSTPATSSTTYPPMANSRPPPTRPIKEPVDLKEKRDSLFGRLGGHLGKKLSLLRKSNETIGESRQAEDSNGRKTKKSFSFPTRLPMHAPVSVEPSGFQQRVLENTPPPENRQPEPEPEARPRPQAQAQPRQVPLPPDDLAPPTFPNERPTSHLPRLSFGDSLQLTPTRSSSPIEPPKLALHIANPDTATSSPTPPRRAFDLPADEPSELPYENVSRQSSRRPMHEAPPNASPRMDSHTPPSRNEDLVSQRRPTPNPSQATQDPQNNPPSVPQKPDPPTPSYQIFPLPPQNLPSSTPFPTAASISQPIVPPKSLLDIENARKSLVSDQKPPVTQSSTTPPHVRTISGPYPLAPLRKPPSPDLNPVMSPAVQTAPLPPPPRSRSRPEPPTSASQPPLVSRLTERATTAPLALPRSNSRRNGNNSGSPRESASNHSAQRSSDSSSSLSKPVQPKPEPQPASPYVLSPLSAFVSAPQLPTELNGSRSLAAPPISSGQSSDGHSSSRSHRPRPPSDTEHVETVEVIKQSSTKRPSKDETVERGRHLPSNGAAPTTQPLNVRSKSAHKSPDKEMQVALENAWTGPTLKPTTPKHRRRSKSWSMDTESTTSRPPTPPPKQKSSTKPPTSGSQRPQVVSRQPSPQKSNGSSSTHHSRSSINVAPLQLQKPTPPIPPTSPRPERHPSQKRPTSSSPDALPQDLLAREAWERDRLLKGQSWVDFPVPAISAPVPAVASAESRRAAGNTNGVGSSYTSFTIQAPFAPPVPNAPKPSTNAVSSGDYYRQQYPETQQPGQPPAYLRYVAQPPPGYPTGPGYTPYSQNSGQLHTYKVYPADQPQRRL